MHDERPHFGSTGDEHTGRGDMSADRPVPRTTASSAGASAFGPSAIYEMEYPAPKVDAAGDSGKGPTLIVALNGYADAGQAVEASADHLKAALDNRLVATFNTDELIDYRSRRPATTIEAGDSTNPVEIESMDLDIRLMKDTADKPFLLLSGPEPDLRWQGFTKAVTELVNKYQVDSTIVLYGAPAPAPHTRPLVVSAHGNDNGLVDRMFRFDSTVIVPGSAPLYIERALAERGHKVAGYTAHVPHYLAASSYPEATLSLLQAVSRAADLDLPLRSLEHDMERFQTQLSEQIGNADEIAGVVSQLEDQYDDYLKRYRNDHPQAILPGEESVPSAEEISAEFEKFLNAVQQESGWREHILTDDINDREDAIALPGEPDASDAADTPTDEPGDDSEA